MRNMCPGRTDRHESGSGAPKSMDGMKFVKVLQRDDDIMKVRKHGTGRVDKNSENESTIINNVFGWSPGINPVTTPVAIPKKRKNNISINIYYNCFFSG